MHAPTHPHLRTEVVKQLDLRQDGQGVEQYASGQHSGQNAKVLPALGVNTSHASLHRRQACSLPFTQPVPTSRQQHVANARTRTRRQATPAPLREAASLTSAATTHSSAHASALSSPTVELRGTWVALRASQDGWGAFGVVYCSLLPAGSCCVGGELWWAQAAQTLNLGPGTYRHHALAPQLRA